MGGMSSVPEIMIRSVDRHGLLSTGTRVLLAVSGGLDSMVMLHLVHGAARSQDWDLVVAHLNHCLRGRSSDADARLVETECRRLSVPCVVGRRDAKAFAKRHKISIEMAAREVRHRFLAQTARKRKCPVVALAHHADDQAELVLMRLLRGSGSEGLGGMRVRNPSPVDAGIQLVRPLLEVTHEALQTFAREQRIRFREDQTNASGAHLRNRVRHELLPLIRKNYQPAVGRVLCRVASILSAEADCINTLASEWLLNRKVRFLNLPLAVRRKVIQQQALSLGLALDFETAEQLLVCMGQKVNGSDGRQLRLRSEGKVEIVKPLKLRRSKATSRLELAGSGQAQFGHLNFSWHAQEAGRWKKPRWVPNEERFDANQLGANVILRYWRAGDRFQPIGMEHPVKLQDLFTNLKVSRADRITRVVAEAANGQVFWVEGLRIGERFKLGPDSRKVLVWRWNC